MKSKKCNCCQIIKTINRFHKNAYESDGLSQICIKCKLSSGSQEQESGFKKCARCNEIKSISDFRNLKSTYDGLHYCCRECLAKANKDLRERNLKIYIKKEKISYQKFSITMKGKMKMWKNGATKRKINWELSLEILNNIPLICYYTGLPLTMKKHQPNSVSLDRVNSSLGYTKENSVFCCQIVNKMKHDFSKDKFVKLARLVVNNFKKETNESTCSFKKLLFRKFNHVRWQHTEQKIRNKYRHKKPFTITFEEINKMPFECFYTKEKLVLESNCDNTVSFDRIDSSEGYIGGNVVLCCKVINYMKFTLSLDEFLYYCKLIATY